MINSDESAAFSNRLNGSFSGILQWQQLDELWERVKQGKWYFYQLGEALPTAPLYGDELAKRIDALNVLLRREHDYHYCGVVYADNVEQPTLIKIFDPNNMGSACSGKAAPSPPGWLLSTDQPSVIETRTPTTNSRKRWWQLFSN